MKKIGKLSINPEKVIKNEELVNLKGGVLLEKSAWWRCCWDNDPDNCSTCSWTDEPTCTSGASAEKCDHMN